MSYIIVGLMFAFMMATAAALLLGLGVMVAGGRVNEKYGNKLMFARVGFQAAAIAMLGLLFLMG